MADATTHADLLRAEGNCPLCGSLLVYFERYGRAMLSAKVRYACGASFATFEDKPVTVDRDCPRPAMVAADALNLKVLGLRGNDG